MLQLKNEFGFILENKYKEGMISHVHKHGLFSLVHEARRISSDVDLKNDSELIEKMFEDCWSA